MSARHAADDSSFARSAGGAAGRGIVLVVIAVLVGIVLLRSGLDGPETEVQAGGPAATTPATVPTESTAPSDTTAPTDTTGGAAPSSDAPPDTIAPNTIKVVVANAAGAGPSCRSSDAG